MFGIVDNSPYWRCLMVAQQYTITPSAVGSICLGCLGFAVVIFAVLFIVYTISIINGLISLRNQVSKAWANIDVLLKQRNDLVPNLVAAVEGYMKHERSVLSKITELRAAMLVAKGLKEKAKASEEISEALKTIFAVAENYPKLRASENFMQLQNQLVAIENQIADRREFYNDTVYLYNTRIHVFPDFILALLMGMKEAEYFRVGEEDKKVPKVDIHHE
ncbi:MAG: LemA family protein [Candidatus Bilamarchaeaceae archaeon]